MLSVPSFKNDLNQFQPLLPRYQKILDRWKSYPGVEKNWKKIQRAAHKRRQTINAEEFIDLVLSATRPVDRLIEHAKAGKIAFQRCRDEIVDAAKSDASPLELSRELEDFAKRLLVLARSHLDFNAPVSRKDQNGSRQRKAFSLTVGVYLHRHCGKWCDAEVAALMDIAYDRKEATSIDEVRLFREATKRARIGKR
jgi:hypothetical protein